MAIQAVGRIGACGDGANDLRSWTVMTGGAGTRPVRGNIMLDAFDFRPVRRKMTAAAEDARRIKGEVVGTDCHWMRKETMPGHLIGVAEDTGYLGAIHSLLNGLPNHRNVNIIASVLMAESTVGTVQGVDVSSIRQGAGTRDAEDRGVAGMTGAT